MNDRPTAPARKVPLPAIGDTVHYFDETRAGGYAKPGAGPYAAIVTLHDVGGLCLHVIGPNGGLFPVMNIRHRSEHNTDDKSRKKWWQRREETAEQQRAAAAAAEQANKK